MRRIDEAYTRRPFYGSRRMTRWLRRQGYGVNRKRVVRLMGEMGLAAIYPRRSFSRPATGSHVFPYLLGGLAITSPNQVWCTDITYLRMRPGFAYLVVIMDWYSRYVVSWGVSSTLDAGFCVAALEEGLRKHRPEIFNSDQGGQFTSQEFIRPLLAAGIRISMDGRGRVYDNIFIERLWRTVKYEEVYLHEYQTVREARQQLAAYFPFYNDERPHQGLGDRTPAEVYHGERKH